MTRVETPILPPTGGEFNGGGYGSCGMRGVPHEGAARLASELVGDHLARTMPGIRLDPELAWVANVAQAFRPAWQG